MFKTTEATTEAKCFNVCQRTSTKICPSREGRNQFRCLTNTLHFTALYFSATTRTQWSQCYM